MLRVLHNHIFASKLRRVFDAGPLVLVYQSLGDVDVAGVSHSLQAAVDKALPGSGVTAEVCRMRNSIAAQTGSPTMQRLFQASNVLVGFSMPQQQQQPAQQRQPPDGAGTAAAGAAAATAAAATSPAAAAEAGLRATRGGGLDALLGGLFSDPASSAQPQPPHTVVKALIGAGLKLPGQAPVVLMGALYRRQAVRLSHLEQWAKLDAGKVYGELLTAIEGPLEGLCEVDAALEGLLAALDAGGEGAGVLDALDHLAAQAPGQVGAEQQPSGAAG